MVHKKRYFIALGLSAITFFCSMIYALVSVDVTNHFQTGIVDINLSEYQLAEKKEIPWTDNPIVLPGDTISKIPRISNKGNDCYVRAKIAFRGTDALNTSHLIGISDQWIAADDGYYYYTEILPHGGTIDLFEAVHIPSDLSQSSEGNPFYLDISVDAIQSKNFTPEFNLATPWGSVEILKNKKDNYDVSTFQQADNQSFQIVYQGNAGKLFKNADDFFANLPYLMPGDSYRDTVTLTNNSREELQLHFRSIAEMDSQLLDRIQLKITTEIDGKTTQFYNGDLRALALSADTILGTLPKGAEGKFIFELQVPADMNNEFSISASAIQWIFSTEATQIPENPKTGDTSVPILALLLMLISGAALLRLTILPHAQKRREASCHQNCNE